MTTEPTDAELKAMWQIHAADIGGIFHYARAVLAKWGQPAQARADSVQEDALSDSVRTPLDSLHADAAYLIGRLRDGSMPYVRVIEIIRERIDAASPTAQAANSVPAPPPPPECETEAEKRAFAFGWFKALESERMKADSVLEDAARYRWLREGNDAKHGAAWHVAVNLYGCEWDAAIDAAMNKGATQ